MLLANTLIERCRRHGGRGCCGWVVVVCCRNELLFSLCWRQKIRQDMAREFQLLPCCTRKAFVSLSFGENCALWSHERHSPLPSQFPFIHTYIYRCISYIHFTESVTTCGRIGRRKTLHLAYNIHMIHGNHGSAHRSIL